MRLPHVIAFISRGGSMTRTVVSVAAGAIVLGAAVVAQDRSPQPGGPTQARVWIENRGDAEAVPVVLTRAPRMEIAGAVVLDPSTVVASRAARQTWDYETVAVPSGTDAAAVLRSSGGDGWEAVGVVSTTPNVVVLMKRPR
jgi:hypothetical protein